MGDRANIRIVQKDAKDIQQSIWLYSHWAGYELPTLLQEALKAAYPRWDDESYLTRIIVDQVMKGGRDKETGWGISVSPGDNEYNVLEVDTEARTVQVRSREGFFSNSEWASTAPVIAGPVGFADYIALPDVTEWRDQRKA